MILFAFSEYKCYGFNHSEWLLKKMWMGACGGWGGGAVYLDVSLMKDHSTNITKGTFTQKAWWGWGVGTFTLQPRQGPHWAQLRLSMAQCVSVCKLGWTWSSS